ncbi:MAG: penicillin acylase family protein [Calothrix sp. SM1_5_4]|nr:penicillin acylase family protein [Calothrix sp. SM1_5_4]
MRLAWLLKRVAGDPSDSDTQWVDDKRTDKVESLPEVVTSAFLSAWESLSEQLGRDPSGWTWKDWNRVQLAHVARLPGFGSSILAKDGSGESIRGIKGRHGPVYKSVIALGSPVKAWMQVPGGNEGDPFSPEFERGVNEWSEGAMREVEFYKDLTEARSRAVRIVEFVP